MVSSTLSGQALSEKSNGGTFWNCSRTASYLGVSPSQVRLLCSSGDLSHYETIGGHRRIDAKSVRLYASGGISEEDGTEEKGNVVDCVGYVRTSGDSQKESLIRQEARLRETIGQRLGMDPASVRIYRDCCSSFGSRNGLNSLIDDCIDGKIKRIYVENHNRWSRVPALSSTLSHLLERYGVELVALDREELDIDQQKIDYAELIDFVQVLGNRACAQKSKLVTVKGLTPQTLERMAELKNKNYELRHIWRILIKEGHKTSKGDDVSYQLVRKYLHNGQAKLAQLATGLTPDDSLTSFLSTHLVKQEEKGVRVSVGEVYERYTQFCQVQGKLPLSIAVFGRTISKIYPRHKIGGVRLIKGYTLVS